MRRPLLVVALLTAASACTDLRHYAPRENLNGTGPDGQPAAVYPLLTESRLQAGEVRLWSRGGRGFKVEDAAGDAARRVEVHVAFELENTGQAPLELAGIRCESQQLSLIRTEGDARANPGTTARLDTWFLAAGANSTREVDDFAIRFEVLADGEPVCAQVTPFSPWRRRIRRDYDPWLFTPGWGFGFGLGLGYHWHCH